MTRERSLRVAAPLWSIGQTAVQVFRDLPSLVLLFYMTQVLAIPPAMAGTAIFVPKLFWAIFCDSMVGIVSDRYRDRFPRRHFLLIGALLVPLAILLLFSATSAATPAYRALHVSLMLAFYMSVFALFSVPHLAIGTEMGRNSDEATIVMGWRIGCAGLGVLIGAALAPILLQHWGSGPEAYRRLAYAMGAVCSTALAISWFGAREAPRLPRDDQPRLSVWRAVSGNRRFLMLFLILMLQLAGSGLAYASLAFMFTFSLGYARPLVAVGIFGLTASVIGMASQPFWVFLARRLGKRTGLIAASLIFAAAKLSAPLLPTGNPLPVYVLAFVLGIVSAGCYLNIYALLADLVEDERQAEGFSRAGLYSGIFTAGEKIGFAIGGTLLVGAILGASGFISGHASQSSGARLGILFCFSTLPAVLYIVSAMVAAIGLRDGSGRLVAGDSR